MQETVVVKKRKDWIDALRALAMILVVYGHQIPGFTEYFVFTSPIKITLFFAITGYVFNTSVTDAKTFFTKTLRQLIVPWIVLSIAPRIILTPFKGLPYLLTHVLNILTGEESWYMPCCIIAEIIWFYLLKYVKRPLYIGSVSIIAFFVGLILYHYSILDFLMINRALCVLVYIFIGHVFRLYEKKWEENNNLVFIVSLCGLMYILLGTITLKYYPGQCLDVHLNRYYNLPICFSMIVLGLLCAFYIAKSIKKFLKVILSTGKNTLVIYLFHNYVAAVIVKMFNMIKIPINPLTNLFVTVLACLICTVISILISQFIPGILGRKRASF